MCMTGATVHVNVAAVKLIGSVDQHKPLSYVATQYIRTYTCTHTYMYICTHTHMYAQINLCTYTHDVHADCRYSYTHTSVTYVLWNTSNLHAITIGKDRYDY